MTSKPSLFKKIRGTLRAGDQWLKQTPERSLEQAYEAALLIKAIEDEHFQGEPILPEFGGHSETVFSYFQAELNQHLTTIKVRLAEFRLSYGIVSFFSPESTRKGRSFSGNDDLAHSRDQSAITLEKLKFIDDAIARYTKPFAQSSKSLVPLSSQPKSGGAADPTAHSTVAEERFRTSEPLTQKTGVLPRSLQGTLSRIQKTLEPNAELEAIEDFRIDRQRTVIALRFLVFLILITLGTGLLAKTFIVGPIVDRFRSGDQVEVFLNRDFQEEALHELSQYEEKLKFQSLIGQIPSLSDEEFDTNVREKASEIANKFRNQGSDAIKNIFADLFSVIGFSLFMMVSRREIAILKSFIDEIVYGLSDSAKAFIIILFTDIFVGFHSPHGWEVLLEGVSRHFGLPESRTLIFLFIATFPVVLDTVFKYWIFRYLNRVSPSAVATLRNMNE
jgi:hypothetical protein